MTFARRLLAGLSCLALVCQADEAVTLQLVGTTEIESSFTAYLREHGSEHVFTLSDGETANGWRITETTRDAANHVLRIHLRRDDTAFWLGVSGGIAHPVPAAAEKEDSKPLIDIPASQRGPLHEQVLHRSRLKHKPEARKARRDVSDLDPFPSKLVR